MVSFVQVITLALVLFFAGVFGVIVTRSKIKAAFLLIMSGLALSIVPAACVNYLPGHRNIMFMLFVSVLVCCYCFSVLILASVYKQKTQKTKRRGS